MNTLREALHEYLTMRRSLGFRLHRVAPRLLDFVTFMEQRRASYITVPLARCDSRSEKNDAKIREGKISDCRRSNGNAPSEARFGVLRIGILCRPRARVRRQASAWGRCGRGDLRGRRVI